jgi:hypothetical protein
LPRIRIEVVDSSLSVFVGHFSCQEANVVACVGEQVLEHFQKPDAVGENKDLVAIAMPELKELVENLPLPTNSETGTKSDELQFPTFPQNSGFDKFSSESRCSYRSRQRSGTMFLRNSRSRSCLSLKSEELGMSKAR